MKNLRKITYKGDYPELRIVGRFLTDKYGWKIGDHVKVDYLPNKIVIKKRGDTYGNY